ncbi:MAG: hypothetical protein ACHQDY_09525 [Solirubrobacterales bacterium]
MTAVAIGGAIAWLLAAPVRPIWPLFIFGAVAVIGLYIMLAPLLHLPPWQKPTPFGRWLEGRIDAYTAIVRERTSRSHGEHLEQIRDWDTQNVCELAGLDLETLQFDRSAATAQDLVDMYRADPRDPERVDGVEPPHGVEQHESYAARRFAWLKAMLKKTQNGVLGARG